MMFTKGSIYVIFGITVVSAFVGLYLLYSNTNNQLVNAYKSISQLEQMVQDQKEVISKFQRQVTIIAEESNNLNSELNDLSNENQKLRSVLKETVSEIMNSNNPNSDIEQELNNTINDLFKGIGK